MWTLGEKIMSPEQAGNEEQEPDPLFDAFREISSEILGVDPDTVAYGSRLKEDLDADSLDLVEIAMGVEERFGIKVPDEALEWIETVKDVLDVIERQLGTDDDGDDGLSGVREPRNTPPSSGSGAAAL